MILVATLSLNYHWFPTTGAVSITTDPWGALMHATLPAIALAVGVIAELARQVRSALIEVLNSQYIRTLRAKGLGSGAVLWKHGLRNISVTMLTLLGLQVNRLFSGAVVIEAVFAIPGVGSLVATSALNKDFPVVQGVVLVLVVIVILVNLAVDVLNALLDPRAAEA
jgi:peptide/nickel transport system permease protein